MTKNILNKIDEKKFWKIFRIVVIALLFVTIISYGGFTLSKYVSDLDVNVSPNVAFFVTDIGTYEDRIELGELLPSNTPYTYVINVSNFEDDRRINVNLEYEIEFITTTNLPLNFKVYRNTLNYTGSGIMTKSEITNDSDGMYFKTLSNDEKYEFTYSGNQTDSYTLWVEFPEVYKNNPDSYEGVIELVEVKVVAKQIV